MSKKLVLSYWRSKS